MRGKLTAALTMMRLHTMSATSVDVNRPAATWATCRPCAARKSSALRHARTACINITGHHTQHRTTKDPEAYFCVLIRHILQILREHDVAPPHWVLDARASLGVSPAAVTSAARLTQVALG